MAIPRLQRLPQDEMDKALDDIFATPEAYDAGKLTAAYEAQGLRVIPDPAARALVDLTIDALRQRRPLAVIRVSDGEMTVIAYRAFTETPALDLFCARASVGKQMDSFVVTPAWLLSFREIMLGSMARADIVGVPGLWQDEGPARSFTKGRDRFESQFRAWPRGLYGDWRGRTYLPKLAGTGLLNGRIVASNHLYLAYVEYLDDLVAAAASVLLMTNHEALLEAMRQRYPGKTIGLIRVGRRKEDRKTKTVPFFFGKYLAELPRDLAGALVLIGAGPWSLVYCQWVRERGGVAIDMGSGMDFLSGERTRASHHRALKAGVLTREG